MGITLTAKARRALATHLQQIRMAESIQVDGYCDGKKINNAKDAAVVRASVVMDELVRLGVPANRLRPHHHTNRAENAVVLTFVPMP